MKQILTISIFFASSFMEEKIKRWLTLLLSTPITPFQIIMGKMLPYILFATATAVYCVLLLAFLSALGFLVGEKLLLFVSVSIVL